MPCGTMSEGDEWRVVWTTSWHGMAWHGMVSVACSKWHVAGLMWRM